MTRSPALSRCTAQRSTRSSPSSRPTDSVLRSSIAFTLSAEATCRPWLDGSDDNLSDSVMARPRLKIRLSTSWSASVAGSTARYPRTGMFRPGASGESRSQRTAGGPARAVTATIAPTPAAALAIARRFHRAGTGSPTEGADQEALAWLRPSNVARSPVSAPA